MRACLFFAEEGSWAELFARDFSNCEVEDGAWKFDAEGCLVPLKDRPIFTKASLSHYELEVVYAMGPKGNSGCLIYDTEHPRAKIEVQMQDDAADLRGQGLHRLRLRHGYVSPSYAGVGTYGCLPRPTGVDAARLRFGRHL